MREPPGSVRLDVALCPTAPREAAAFRPASRARGMGWLLCCAPSVACSPTAYLGTGSFQISGEPSALLGTQTVVLRTCGGTEIHAGEDSRKAGSGPVHLLSIGEACTLEWVDSTEELSGALCTIAFSEGAHTLRVTDVVARYPNGQPINENVYASANYVDLELGGNDVATGKHALYRFSGRGISVDHDSNVCAQERARFEGRAPRD